MSSVRSFVLDRRSENVRNGPDEDHVRVRVLGIRLVAHVENTPGIVLRSDNHTDATLYVAFVSAIEIGDAFVRSDVFDDDGASTVNACRMRVFGSGTTTVDVVSSSTAPLTPCT